MFALSVFAYETLKSLKLAERNYKGGGGGRDLFGIK